MQINTLLYFHLDKEDYDFIREQMKAQKLTVVELSKFMNISRKKVYSMLTGKSNASDLISALTQFNIAPKYSINMDHRNVIL